MPTVSPTQTQAWRCLTTEWQSATELAHCTGQNIRNLKVTLAALIRQGDVEWTMVPYEGPRGGRRIVDEFYRKAAR